MPTRFDVHTGTPSWHQARAGAISAGITSFATRGQANAYLANVKTLRPTEPAFILTREV